MFGSILNESNTVTVQVMQSVHGSAFRKVQWLHFTGAVDKLTGVLLTIIHTSC